ncbi:MAG TPA: hypothetical protein VM513_34605 [Kofleriaceae bacterium]|nr:hypothetical protein [Kofleriaceae bacterium]
MTAAHLPDMLRALAAILLVSAVGCAPTTIADDPNDQPPTLEVMTPQRGTQAQGSQVTVSGRVTDDKPGVKVKINGIEVAPAADGSFSASIDVPAGVSIIETHAIDSKGNDLRDARAVMAGSLAPTDGSLASPLAASISAPALATIGSVLATQAEAIDFTAAAMAMNPIYSNTGCLGAVLDVQSVSLSNIDVGLVPAAGALEAAVTIDDVAIVLKAKYKVACIGGSTTIRVTSSKARINGALAIAVQGGALATSLPSSSVQLDGFGLDIGGIPGALESLVRGEARKAAEKALTEVIRDQVPPMANDAFANVLAKPFSTSLFGHATTLAITPGQVTLSPSGLFVAVDTKVAVAGGEGGMFVQQSGPVSQTMMSASGVGVAIANDTVNQLFAGLWAAGALEQDVGLDSIPGLGAILDDDAASLSIELLLPPTVGDGSGALELSIGDMILDVKDASGTTIQNIAMSLRTSLDVVPSQTGGIRLTAGQPEIFAQMLVQTEAVDRPLTDMQFEGIVSGAWGLVAGQANKALEAVPLPSVAGVTLGAPTVDGRDGFLIADVPLQ